MTATQMPCADLCECPCWTPATKWLPCTPVGRSRAESGPDASNVDCRPVERRQFRECSLEELISESVSFLDPHRLIALAIPSNASEQRISDNVVLLDRAKSEIRTGILGDIEELSDRLIARRCGIFPDDFVRSWARLLVDSGVINQRAQTRAAGSVLSSHLGNVTNR